MDLAGMHQMGWAAHSKVGGPPRLSLLLLGRLAGMCSGCPQADSKPGTPLSGPPARQKYRAAQLEGDKVAITHSMPVQP